MRRKIIAPRAPAPAYDTVVITPEVGVVLDSVTVDDDRASVTTIGETIVVQRQYKDDADVLSAFTSVELV